MPRALYAFTHYTPEHGITYTCNTYPASLSRKYGICQSLHDPDTLDLGAMSWGPVSVGNVISVCVLLACVLAILVVLKWALDERRRRRRECWVREGQKRGLVGVGAAGAGAGAANGTGEEGSGGRKGWWVVARERGTRREFRLS